MESKDLVKFYIHFGSYCLKIKLNKLKSEALRCDNFVIMILKKLKKLNDQIELSSVEKYGLFESCNGVDMLIPDSQLILGMDKLLHSINKFFIREKYFFELNQNNELTDSVRSKILSYYRNSRQNARKKPSKLAKSNLVTLKAINKQLISKNYIKKTQILKLSIAQNVHSKDICCAEERMSRILLIRKIIKFKKF